MAKKNKALKHYLRKQEKKKKDRQRESALMDSLAKKVFNNPIQW